MKKLLVIASIFVSIQVSAQQTVLYLPTTIGASSNNNIGIGTGSPQTTFEVIGNTYIRNTGTSGYASFRLYNDQNSATRSLEIDYSGSQYGSALVTGGPTGESGSITTTGAYPLTFGTNNTMRMTIKSDGNVGIGNSSPQVKLDIGSTQNDGLQFRYDASTNYRIRLTPYWNSSTDTRLDFNVERVAGQGFSTVMSVGYGNNVGVGTTSPSFKFHIRGGNANSDLMTLGSNTTGNFALTSADGGAYGLFGGVSNSGRAWLQAGRYDSNTAYDLLLQSSGGNVGIGNTSPAYTLDVEGFGSRFKNSSQATNAYTTFRVQGPNYTQGLEIDFFGNNNVTTEYSYGGGAGSAAIVNVNNKPLILGTNNLARVFIEGGGNVAIGTTDSKGYKLAVAGKTVTEEVVVKLQANWPDYVFEPNYKLQTLPELEQYIKTNKHLPEVPSAEQVKENGLSVGEMNAILLKKVEELTLHLIEMKKENDDLQKRVNKLENK